MNNILNKSILFLGIFTMLFLSYESEKIVIPLLLAVAISSLSEFFGREKISFIFFSVYVLVSIVSPIFLLVLPVIFYDIFLSKYQVSIFLVSVPWIINWNHYNLTVNLTMLILLVVSGILKYKAVQYEKLHKEYISKRDELTEMSLNLEKRVEDLMGREDFQVNIATLNERNRIAREIHDNVGHLLTSSILQIGAVMAITKEEATKEMLSNIRNTLGEGMSSIRSSVHNLHEGSIDLYVQLTNIIKNFTFCEAVLNYEIIEEMNINIKYAVISIVKEGLSNVMKHSNASNVTVSLYEHPRLYQLIIIDNGTKKPVKKDIGMGLEGIKNRVSTLGGIVNFDGTNGFKIFISFMKEVKEEGI